MTAARASTDDEPVALELLEPAGRRRRRLPRVELPTWLRAESPALTWIGLLVAAAGFVLIGIAWSQVAGETQVYLQLPYLVSAGLTGLGLVMVGVTVVNVSAKRRDAVERARQTDQLVSILEEVKAALGERGTRRR
jgi:hypothetical protein